MRSRLVVFCGLGVAAILSAATFRAAAETAEKPTLRVGVADPEQVDSLDPALAFMSLSWELMWSTCTPPMEVPSSRSGQGVVPRPAAAEAYPRVSRDGRTYTFTIRRGLRFSDGSPITAANYARGLGRARSPAMQSGLLSSGLYLDDISSATAEGRTLRVRLTKPNSGFVSRMTLPLACPVPLETPIDPAGVDLTIGSGPYHVASFARSQQVVLRPNRHYRGPHPPRFSAIVVTIGGTIASLYRDAQAGRIDVVWDSLSRDPTVSGAAIERYGIGKTQLFYRHSLSVFYYALNTKRGLFRGNAPLRRAVNFALDRREVLREFFPTPTAAIRTDQLLPFDIPGFVDRDLFPLGGPNLRVARRLARGHERSRRAVLYSSVSPRALHAAQVVAYNLKQIGLEVEIKSFALGVLQAKLSTPGEPYDLAQGGWTADYPDPFTFLGPLLGRGSKWNTSHLDDASVERRLRAAQRITGPARYRALGNLEQDVLRTQAPYAPFAVPTGLLFVSPRVGCVTFRFGNPMLSSLCLRSTG
ncbi:MAG: ABC transporter substrate-binding protein [Thermoleophilia bacterium]